MTNYPIDIESQTRFLGGLKHFVHSRSQNEEFFSQCGNACEKCAKAERESENMWVKRRSASDERGAALTMESAQCPGVGQKLSTFYRLQDIMRTREDAMRIAQKRHKRKQHQKRLSLHAGRLQ